MIWLMTDKFGVIFDVDGVLVDSYDAHLRSWQMLGAERGFSFTETRFVETFGRTTREIIRETFGPDRFSSGQIAALDARKEALFRELLARDFPVMDGAVALIDELYQAGYRLAVGSSGPPENVQLVLDSLGRAACFRGVVTGMDVTRGKPDPQVFLTAADRLGLDPCRCVVIEDATAGVRAAKRAGMRCVGFVSRGHRDAELSEADLLVRRLSELSSAAVARLLESCVN